MYACIENHRPVAIACVISLIHERLTDYFMNNGILSGNELGFSQGKNAELAVFHLIVKILPAFDYWHLTVSVFS